MKDSSKIYVEPFLDKGPLFKIHNFEEEEQRIRSIVFAPDDKFAIIGNHNGEIAMVNQYSKDI